MWLINKTTSSITIDSYNLTIPGRSQVDIGDFVIDSKYLAGLEYAEAASTDRTLKTCISEIDSEPAKIDITMLANKAPGAIRDLVRLNNGDLLTLSNYLCDYYRSTDNGNTWSKEQVIINSSVVEVSAKHLRYIDGTIFITVVSGSTYKKKVLKSTDNGHTWEVQSVATGDTANSYGIIDIMKHPDGHWAVAGTYSGKTYCTISDSIEGTSCVTFTSAMTNGSICLLTVAGVYTALITEKYLEVINNTTGEKFTYMTHNTKTDNTTYTFNVDGNYLLTDHSRGHISKGYIITQYIESDGPDVSPARQFNISYADGHAGIYIYPFGALTLPYGKLLWYGRSQYSNKLNFTLTDKFTSEYDNIYAYAKASTDTAESLSEDSVDTAVGYIDTAGKPIVIFGKTGTNAAKAATAAFVPEKVNGVEVYPDISLAIGTRILLQWKTEYGDIQDEIIVVSDYTNIQEEIHSYTEKYAKRIVSVRILSAEL